LLREAEKGYGKTVLTELATQEAEQGQPPDERFRRLGGRYYKHGSP